MFRYQVTNGLHTCNSTHATNSRETKILYPPYSSREMSGRMAGFDLQYPRIQVDRGQPIRTERWTDEWLGLLPVRSPSRCTCKWKGPERWTDDRVCIVSKRCNDMIRRRGGRVFCLQAERDGQADE
jgi:hypothetical protein